MFHVIPDCGGAQYARNNGIPVILFPKAKDEPEGLSPSDLVDTLRFDASFIDFLQLFLTLDFGVFIHFMNLRCKFFAKLKRK